MTIRKHVLPVILGSTLLLFGTMEIFYRVSPAINERSYIVEQKLIPVFLMHPKDRIYAYIANARTLFTLSQMQPDPAQSVALATRAEHSMTLLVGELWRMNNTEGVSSSLLFQTYINQDNLLTDMIAKSTGDVQKQFITLLSFSRENKKVTKTIYYNAIPPGVNVPL